jgi:predicted O-methyltransferase YrrM
VIDFLGLLLMNKLFIIKEYLQYQLKAKGIDNIHSPFVYEFISNVLRDNRTFYAYEEIEKQRSLLLSSDKKIYHHYLGTGKRSASSIRNIVKVSVKPRKQAQLLFRIAAYYRCRHIIEIGSSVGITTLYLASASEYSLVITLEGEAAIAEEAQRSFDALGKKNIHLLIGSFEDTLTIALQRMPLIDLIFFDGNHRKDPTFHYFHTALQHSNEHSIFVFDDIHWSWEMKEAWNMIKSHSDVKMTIDIFHFGIVFFRKELSKQHFILRF